MLLEVNGHVQTSWPRETEVPGVCPSQQAPRAVSCTLLRLLNIHEDGIRQIELTLVPHLRACQVAVRQSDRLGRPVLTKLKCRRHHRRRRRLNVKTICVAQVRE